MKWKRAAGRMLEGLFSRFLVPQLFVALIFLLAPPAIAATSKNVLVLHYNTRSLPANIEFNRGLREAIAPAGADGVVVFDEFLDMPRFGGDDYDRVFATFLREKYASKRPAVIVVAGDEALGFLLRQHASLFPEVPVVHGAVFETFLQPLAQLPRDVVGVAASYDFSGTISQALRWHPRAHHLVIVTGASRFDRAFEAQLRKEVPPIAGRLQVEYLAALPNPEVLRRLGALGRESVVFSPGYFQDGGGRQYAPRDSIRGMADVSGAPVYGAFDTHLGTGIVGGRMPTFAAMGSQAGSLVNALLAGAAPESLRMPPGVPARLHVDWRQVRRWNIDVAQIPRDAVIHFREPSFFERYRSESIVALVVFLLQAILIALLLAERRRRRLAEFATLAQRLELAHASRLMVAGELTGAIAHEINQPLGAILSNADAAELILDAEGDHSEELRQILADIRRDDLRASEVIRRLRALLGRHEVERQTFELNEVVLETESLLRSEARRRRVTFEVHPAAGDVTIFGDRIQIQQVLINLMLNAVEAVSELPEERRSVSVTVERIASGIDIAVRDQGEGIAPEELSQLFDAFYTTKAKGMGLGLKIVRSIVEAHGGSIHAASTPGVGAVFHVVMPEGDVVQGTSRGTHD